jgi:hypothetical protein
MSPQPLKKNGARPGQWNRDGSWLSFNVFQCLKMLSKCLTLSMLTIAKDCLTIPLVFLTSTALLCIEG